MRASSATPPRHQNVSGGFRAARRDLWDERAAMMRDLVKADARDGLTRTTTQYLINRRTSARSLERH
jgi:hypothetical protein